MPDERSKRGVILILADVPPQVEADYGAWWDEEHLPQRLECPGVISGRRWVATEGEPRHLTQFDVESTSAVDTDEYLHLSKNPTDRTKSIVGQIKSGRLVYAEQSSVGPEASVDQVSGLMLVTFDLADAFQAEYEAWYKAHDQKMMKVPGLLRLRRFTVVGPGPNQCCLVDFVDPGVVDSAAYQAARSDPGREKLSGHFEGFRKIVYAPV